MKIPVSGLIRDLVQAALLAVRKREYEKPAEPKPEPGIVLQAEEIRQLRKDLKARESALSKLGWTVNTYDNSRLYNSSSWESKARGVFDRAQADKLQRIRDLEMSLRLEMLGAEAPELKRMLLKFQKELASL